MGDIHVTRDLLLGVLRGELPTEALTRVGLEHLLRLCPVCRREFEAFRQEAEAERDTGLILAGLDIQVNRLEQEHRRAEEDLQGLLALPKEEAVGRIRRSRRRFRGSHLVHLLLEESQKRLTTGAEEALHLAELAHLVVQNTPFNREVLHLLVLTHAAVANTSRLTGNTQHAEEHFGHARYLLTHHSVTDTALLARIDDLESSLRRDQRRLGEAEKLLSRAASLYKIMDAHIDLARVLLNLGATYNHQGKTALAIDITRAALEELSPESEPRLYMNGRYNLAMFLVESGEPGQAAAVLDADAALYERYPEPWVQLRLKGLRGKIAAARRDFATAETLLLEMRDGFLEAQSGYDAAIVSMDLALLYLRQGRTAELKALAKEMLPIFRSQDVHREALAALVLFQEAIREESVTAAFVRELAIYLDEARRDPSLRFLQRSKPAT